MTYSTACLLTPALASLRANCVYPAARAGRRSVPPLSSFINSISLSCSRNFPRSSPAPFHSPVSRVLYVGKLLIRESRKQRHGENPHARVHTSIIIIPRVFNTSSKTSTPRRSNRRRFISNSVLSRTIRYVAVTQSAGL